MCITCNSLHTHSLTHLLTHLHIRPYMQNTHVYSSCAIVLYYKCRVAVCCICTASEVLGCHCATHSLTHSHTHLHTILYLLTHFLTYNTICIYSHYIAATGVSRHYGTHSHTHTLTHLCSLLSLILSWFTSSLVSSLVCTCGSELHNLTLQSLPPAPDATTLTHSLTPSPSLPHSLTPSH